MTRKRRRRATTPATTPAFKTTAGWQWRSFPVFFAFVCGAFVMGLLNGATNPVGLVFFYIILFGVAFGAAHIVTRWFAEWRSRRQTPSPEGERNARDGSGVPEEAGRRH